MSGSLRGQVMPRVLLWIGEHNERHYAVVSIELKTVQPSILTPCVSGIVDAGLYGDGQLGKGG